MGWLKSKAPYQQGMVLIQLRGLGEGRRGKFKLCHLLEFHILVQFYRLTEQANPDQVTPTAAGSQ